MLLSCTICSDYLTPTSDNYVTPCGHIFHYNCLMKWLREKQICPQCRHKTTERSIHKLFLNVDESEGGENHEELLQKVHNLECEKTSKSKDIKELKSKIKELDEKCSGLRHMVLSLEESERSSKSVILALRDQVSYFKKKSKEVEKLKEETNQLKETLSSMDKVESVLHGSKADVEEILRNERSMSTLALLSVSLKKSLVESQQQKKEMEQKYRQAQASAVSYKKDAKAFQTMVSELRSKLEKLKSQYEEEKRVWGQEKQVIRDKITRKVSSQSMDESLGRIVMESPIPLKTTTPVITWSEKPKESRDNTDSPYLPVKSSNVAGFGRLKLNVNGLGDTGKKEDVFPSPRPRTSESANTLKRKKSYVLPTNKFKKLAPSKSNNKLTNYFSEEDMKS